MGTEREINFTPELCAGVAAELREEYQAELARFPSDFDASALAIVAVGIKLELAQRMDRQDLIDQYAAEVRDEFIRTKDLLQRQGDCEALLEQLDTLVSEDGWNQRVIERYKESLIQIAPSLFGEPPDG